MRTLHIATALVLVYIGGCGSKHNDQAWQQQEFNCQDSVVESAIKPALTGVEAHGLILTLKGRQYPFGLYQWAEEPQIPDGDNWRAGDNLLMCKVTGFVGAPAWRLHNLRNKELHIAIERNGEQ
jgi:hypothetical protein